MINNSTSFPFVSIIIPCRNEQKFIGRCIDSIVVIDYSKEKLEVLVVDGMSEDNTREIINQYSEKYPFIRLLDNPQKIVSTALNIGIKSSNGEIIIRMDVHTEYEPDYITCCLKVLEQTEANNVGGAWVPKGESYLQKSISLSFQSAFASGGAHSHDAQYEGPVDSVYLGCWKKTIFEKIGFFDEGFVRNQDDELNLRLVRSGGKIWQSPKIKSWYYPRDSIVGLFKQYVQYGYWKVRIIQKHKIPASIRHIVPGLFVGLLILLGVFSPFSQLALNVLIMLVACYVFVNVGTSLVTCKETSKWQYIPVMPLIFFVYHFGYGYGFLHGILDFVVLKRQAGTTFTKLTRDVKLDTK